MQQQEEASQFGKEVELKRSIWSSIVWGKGGKARGAAYSKQKGECVHRIRHTERKEEQTRVDSKDRETIRPHG